jgi:hypothetical protein
MANALDQQYRAVAGRPLAADPPSPARPPPATADQHRRPSQARAALPALVNVNPAEAEQLLELAQETANLRWQI